MCSNSAKSFIGADLKALSTLPRRIFFFVLDLLMILIVALLELHIPPIRYLFHPFSNLWTVSDYVSPAGSALCL